MGKPLTPAGRAEAYRAYRDGNARNRVAIDGLLEQMTDTMELTYGAIPCGPWHEHEGDADTPMGVRPSINLHRRFATAMEVVFYTTTGVFCVFRDEEKVDEYHTRY